jgi:predicted GNAT family acetyltransferase
MMNQDKFKLQLDENGEGAFVLEENGARDAEMVVSINGSTMTVHHTEVSERLRGKGVAGELLNTMVQYARDHNLKVVPRCAFVHTAFQRHPDQYEDVWKR